MFVYSFRASSLKAVASVTFALIILVTLILTVPSYKSLEASGEEISYEGVKSTQDAADFLKQFGWEVSSKPVEVTETKIPSEFDSVFSEYSELQVRQGLDLAKYRRKNVTRYTFEITNYPEGGEKVLASVITYKGRVIAGDLCRGGENGFIVGFDGKE